jgi:hypothetical protein
LKTFWLAINMAGAISAGAYTAGVLDFLTEALDAWYAAKARGELVPTHDVSIEAFSGASAGGMCAAISAMLLQHEFEHISDTSKTNTTNRFYESWVNRIDICELLKTDDLKKNKEIVSLLDSTILDSIATYALSPVNPLTTPRPYVSPDLTLFLSLTNLRGVPYSLTGVGPGSVEETTFFYGDRIRFQTVRADSGHGLADTAYPLDFTTEAADWSVLQSAAKATGAFPVFLAPRVLERRKTDYDPPLWESRTSAAQDAPPPIYPTFPTTLANPFPTLNVDGGVTNNDPFNYVHDYLAGLSPSVPGGRLESDACLADRAVLSVAPFPTTDEYPVKFNLEANASIFKVVPQLFTALIAQSRFFGESLRHLMTGSTFSHFVVAPDDHELIEHARKLSGRREVKKQALQCASLGAFGGFFDRGFRAHDYALGRRNCQKFLSDHFVLPENNVIMREALKTISAGQREALDRDYSRKAPLGPDGAPIPFPPESGITAETKWFPVVPLLPELRRPVEARRVQMDPKRLDTIVDQVAIRFKALAGVLRRSIPNPILRFLLIPLPGTLAFFGRRPLKRRLAAQLGTMSESG